MPHVKPHAAQLIEKQEIKLPRVDRGRFLL